MSRCPCALKLPQLQVTRTSNLPLVSECPTRCGCAHYDTFLGSLRWWTSQFQCRCNQMWISGTLKSRYTPHNISQLLKAHRKVKSRFRGSWGESAFHRTWMARSEWAAWSVVRVAHGASTRKIDENNTHWLLFVSRWISRDHGVPVSHSPEAPDVGEAVWILGVPVKSPSLTYETLKKLTNSDPRPSCWLSTWWKRRKWYCGWVFWWFMKYSLRILKAVRMILADDVRRKKGNRTNDPKNWRVSQMNSKKLGLVLEIKHVCA